jgi:uncharacterized cofD-like protein
MNSPKIVVIGGGTGSFSVLNGLKRYYANITAIVNMADDGGSTGTLRDELGVLPPGDVRQCLVALARAPEMRDLFNYRFAEGTLKGHSFGNLFLTATEKLTGAFRSGVTLASKVLNITGAVEPSIINSVCLCAKDGTNLIRGEDQIGAYHFVSKTPTIWLEPVPIPNPAALAALSSADYIIIAPGDLYRSLAPILVVPEISQALKVSKAPKVYISNLINKPSHTAGFYISDYVSEIERLAGHPFIDLVIYNTNPPNPTLLKKYAADGELPVRIDPAELKNAPYKSLGADLLATEIAKTIKGDPLRRTLIRHDPTKIAGVVKNLLT